MTDKHRNEQKHRSPGFWSGPARPAPVVSEKFLQKMKANGASEKAIEVVRADNKYRK